MRIIRKFRLNGCVTTCRAQWSRSPCGKRCDRSAAVRWMRSPSSAMPKSNDQPAAVFTRPAVLVRITRVPDWPAAAAAPAAAPAAPAPSGTGPQLDVKGLEAPRRSPEQLSYSAPSLDASPAESGKAKAAKSATVSGTKETPRNAPCPCGSGKKFKQCHGAAGR